MKRFFIAALIALPSFAFSQTAQHLKASEQFAEASGVKASFDGVVDSMLGTQIGAIPEQYREKFRQVMKAFMGKYFTYEVLKPRILKMYTDEFTEAELNELTKFYSSPTGKKYASKMTGLMEKGMDMGRKVIEEHKPELESMMKEAFKQ